MPTCVQLLPPGTKLSEDTLRRLVKIWDWLIHGDACTFTVVEDLEGKHPGNIEGFGMSIFVTPEFGAEMSRDPQPYLTASIYERLLAGCATVLTSEQLVAANAGAGFDVVTLHFGLRNYDLANPRTGQALAAGGAGFYFFHTGYRINSFFNEVYGMQSVQYMQSGGFFLAKDWHREQPSRFADTPEDQHPYLFTLRRELIAPGAIHPLSQIFSPAAPRLGFSALERRVLEGALLNQTDPEIAEALELSNATIKKTWAAIYARVGRKAPYLIPTGEAISEGQRGPEKRRHLLGYLRMHLEELRPGHERVNPSQGSRH